MVPILLLLTLYTSVYSDVSIANISTGLVNSYMGSGVDFVVGDEIEFIRDGHTNAVDAKLLNIYMNDIMIGKILFTKTIKSPYDHDFTICKRFNRYSLTKAFTNRIILQNSLSPISPVDTTFFWSAEMEKGHNEVGTFFNAYINPKTQTATIFSPWHSGLIEMNEEYEYIINTQIYSYTAPLTNVLLQQILCELSKNVTLDFSKVKEYSPADFFAKHFWIENNSVHIVTQNLTTDTIKLDVSGKKWYCPDRKASKPFAMKRSITPGLDTITIDYGERFFEALVDLKSPIFCDRLYTGNQGFWFSYSIPNDSANSQRLSIIKEKDIRNTPKDGFTFPEDVRYSTKVNGQGLRYKEVGIVRTAGPNGVPVNFSDHDGIEVELKSENPTHFQVAVELDMSRDFDRHQKEVYVDNSWKKIKIAWDEFKQQGYGIKREFDPSIIKSFVFKSPYNEEIDTVQRTLLIRNLKVYKEKTKPQSLYTHVIKPLNMKGNKLYSAGVKKTKINLNNLDIQFDISKVFNKHLPQITITGLNIDNCTIKAIESIKEFKVNDIPFLQIKGFHSAHRDGYYKGVYYINLSTHKLLQVGNKSGGIRKAGDKFLVSAYFDSYWWKKDSWGPYYYDLSTFDFIEESQIITSYLKSKSVLIQ